MVRFGKALVLVCLGAALVVPVASSAGAVAATRYVSTAGTDAGACTSSGSPCKTINYAVGQAAAGDTILVAAGTYPEMVNVDRSLVFQGANAGVSAGAEPEARGAESIVKGFRSPANTSGWPYPDVDQEYSTTIDGFTIDPQGDAALISASTHHLVALFGGPDVQVRNNVFDGGPYDEACGYDCTTMTDSALNVQSGTFTISDNLFNDFRAPIDISQHDEAHPIVSGTIADNAFTHITSRAIWLYDDSAPGNYPGVTVSGNDFDATGWNNPSWGPAGVVITTGGNQLEDNTFQGFSSGVFIQVCDGSSPGTDPNVYTGNHFLANGTGIHYYVVGTSGCDTVHATITDNDFVGNTKWGVRWNGESGFTAPNDLDATCNYWGAIGGAGSPGADKATANVTTDPWNNASGGPCNGITHPFADWTAFVQRQYQDLTATAPSSSALATWVADLGDGSKTKGDLIEALRRSADNTHNIDPTERLYGAFLQRTPDAGGLRFWVARRRTGTWTLVRMADHFAASSEFKAKYGPLTNRQFVTRIYTDVLGREPDQAGVDYWTRQLDLHRRSRGSVMVGFSESSEYRTLRAEATDAAVAWIYLMGRTPTTPELTDWVTRQQGSTTQAELATELLSGQEYADHIG